MTINHLLPNLLPNQCSKCAYRASNLTAPMDQTYVIGKRCPPKVQARHAGVHILHYAAPGKSGIETMALVPLCQATRIPTPMAKFGDNLFLGDIINAADIRTLEAHKITAVMNVAVNYANPVTYPAHIKSYRSGMVDRYGNPPYLFTAAVLTLAGLLWDKEVVLVHCRAGVSRSPSVIAAYLAWTQDITLTEAIEVIQANRPRAVPHQPLLDEAVAFMELAPKLPHPSKAVAIRPKKEVEADEI